MVSTQYASACRESTSAVDQQRREDVSRVRATRCTERNHRSRWVLLATHTAHAETLRGPRLAELHCDLGHIGDPDQ